MPGKASLFFVFFMLIALLLFIPSSPTATRDMDEAETRSAGAGHGLSLAEAENRPGPVSRIVHPAVVSPGMKNLPEEDMGMITAGEPAAIYTLNVRGNPVGLDHNLAQRDLKVTFWAPIDKGLEPLAAEHELWLPIHYFKIRRTYYDVGMERYGWELDYQDRADLWRRVYITGVGLDGKPLQLERVNEELKYSPNGFQPWRHRITEPFTNISGGGRISWHWRHAYIVHFKKLHGPSITDVPANQKQPESPYIW